MGYVVADIQGSGDAFAQSLGGSWDHRIFHDPIQRVHVSFITLPGTQVSMELVEPAADHSPVRAFLERGGGLHHICYEVLDCETVLMTMRTMGALIVRRPKPAVAFDGRSIAWVLTPQKLLVELLQTAAK